MKKTWIVLYITIVFILLGFGVYLVKTDNKTLTLPAFYLSNNIPLPEKQVASPSAELAIVKRVIDGDTIVLSDDRRVRYIGINAPEMASSKAPIRCFAQEATNKNRELVEGKKISMQKDISEVDKWHICKRIPCERRICTTGHLSTRYKICEAIQKSC